MPRTGRNLRIVIRRSTIIGDCGVLRKTVRLAKLIPEIGGSGSPALFKLQADGEFQVISSSEEQTGSGNDTDLVGDQNRIKEIDGIRRLIIDYANGKEDLSEQHRVSLIDTLIQLIYSGNAEERPAASSAFREYMEIGIKSKEVDGAFVIVLGGLSDSQVVGFSKELEKDVERSKKCIQLFDCIARRDWEGLFSLGHYSIPALENLIIHSSNDLIRQAAKNTIRKIKGPG